jgi:hypothetical protein
MVKKLRKMEKYREIGKEKEEQPAPEIIQKEEKISEEKVEQIPIEEAHPIPIIKREETPSFTEFGGLSRKERVVCELEMLEVIAKKIQEMLFMINSATISNFQEDYKIYPDVSDFISRAKQTLEKQNLTIFELTSVLNNINYAVMHMTRDLLKKIRD